MPISAMPRRGISTPNLGGNTIYNPMEFKRLTSHDFKLGMRFSFDVLDSRPAPYYAPPPVYQQPPVYAPAPMYVQPPLRSRG